MPQVLAVLGATILRPLATLCDSPREPNSWNLLAGSALRVAAVWLLLLSTRVVAPLWPLLPAVLLVALISKLAAENRWTTVLIDSLLVLVLGWTCVPTPAPSVLMLLSGYSILLGLLGSLVVKRYEWRLMPALSIILLALAVASMAVIAWNYDRRIWRQHERLPFLSVSLQNRGERVELENGAVAWASTPDGEVRGTAVLFLHGAHSAGSAQPASVALRAALSGAGYRVLSLDFLGFGDSPAPEDLLAVESWDEAPSLEEALRYLASQDGVSRIVVIGHSMGCLAAMRSLEMEPRPARALLFGAAMVQELGRDDYWLDRFHSDRRLPAESVPMPLWRSIHRAYFDGRSIARSLPRDHPTIVLIDFDREHQDVEMTRDQYFYELGDNVIKEFLEGSHHYFNSVYRGPVFLTDWQLIRRLVRLLPEWIDGSDSSTVPRATLPRTAPIEETEP